MQRQAVAPGTPVRLRVLNTDNGTLSVTLAGTPFRVAAIDGGEVSGPTDLVDTVIRVAAGGRDDLTFTMQDHPVLLAGVGFDVGPALLLSPDGGGDPPPVRAGTEFDPLHYGNPTPTPFDATSPVDSDPAFVLDDGPRFFDGQFGFHTTINGASFPDTPMQMVREGDLVRNTFVNRSHSPHPMHLHGHHALVLSRDGAGQRQPLVGRHARGATRRDLRHRLPSRQPRPVDGPLPQPVARRDRDDHAPGLRGRHDSLRRRSGHRKPARMSR